MNDLPDLLEIIRRGARILEPVPTGLKTRGDLSRRVGAVLFDLYGTLFISGSGGFDSADPPADEKPLSALLGAFGIEKDPAAVLRKFRERILGEHERMRKEGVDFPEVRIEEVWRDALEMECGERARRFAVEYECLANPVWPMPHAKELIEELNGAGVVLGIVSNAQFFTPLLFRVFFDSTEMEMGFDEELIFYSYLHGRAKPSLFPFEKARDLLNKRSIMPQNVLFVGNDVENDVFPAFRTGFQTALFSGDRRSLRTGNVELEPGCRFPDLLVASLEELSALLKTRRAGQDSSQRTS
jgi:putative hydrolase of the HAD superfamily